MKLSHADLSDVDHFGVTPEASYSPTEALQTGRAFTCYKTATWVAFYQTIGSYVVCQQFF